MKKTVQKKKSTTKKKKYVIKKTPTVKRKHVEISSSDSDVGQDVTDIMPSSQRRKITGKKVPANIPAAPLDNISFHFESSAQRWRFVYHQRIARERAACECSQMQGDHVFDSSCRVAENCHRFRKML